MCPCGKRVTCYKHAIFPFREKGEKKSHANKQGHKKNDNDNNNNNNARRSDTCL